MGKTWDLSVPSLCKKFEKYFMVGNIVSGHEFQNEDLTEMYKHHYNAVTAENTMKPMYVSPSKGEYTFDQVDEIVNWAVGNNIKLVGHTLVWHGQSARWLNTNEDGTPVTRAEAKANMEEFIKTYVSRYSGKIHSWDVINEAFIDTAKDEGYSGDWRDYLRRESDNPRAVGQWYLAYANGADTAKGETGADYVFDAFYFARKYDPKAILYYNEYNEEFEHKKKAITQMVTQINELWKNHPEYDNRMLIEGIGMQSHQNHKNTEISLVREALEMFSATGAKIAVTELDFTFGSPEEPSSPLTAEESKRQAQMYADLFKLYVEFSDSVERVTFWGKNDLQSWREWGSPLLFDKDCQPKEAFDAVMSVV